MAEAEEGVIVEQDAAIGLTHYLTEIGRLGNRTVRDVGVAIQSSVNSQWGSAKVKGFQDKEGPGWIIDMTEKFGGEVVYAIVRANKGKRHVVRAMGEDELAKMIPKRPKQSKQPNAHLDEMPTMEQTGIDSKNPNGPTLAQQRDQLAAIVNRLKEENEKLKNELSTLRTANSNGPALLRWTPPVMSENEIPEEEMTSEEITTVAEVGGRIGELISSGIDPQHIEVWSQRKQPKVRVELE